MAKCILYNMCRGRGEPCTYTEETEAECPWYYDEEGNGVCPGRGSECDWCTREYCEQRECDFDPMHYADYGYMI